MKQEKARLIDLPKIVDPRGNLTVAEQMKNIPFDIARVYWTYDVPSGERRGGHAHRTCEEIVIAVSGSFDVTVDDGQGGKEIYHLNHPYQGLYIGTGLRSSNIHQVKLKSGMPSSDSPKMVRSCFTEVIWTIMPTDFLIFP